MNIKLNNTFFDITPKELVVTRIIDHKVYKFPMNVDGTIEDLIKKVNNVDNLDNLIFQDFAGIYKSSLLSDD